MKTNRYKIQLTCVIVVFWLNGITVSASETASIQWNELAQSQVVDSNELAKLGDAFPTWKIKQVVWPSIAEIGASQVVVDPNLTTTCVNWLTKFVAKDQLPANLNEKLVAMEEWGVIR